jgi:hypothetical protein
LPTIFWIQFGFGFEEPRRRGEERRREKGTSS